MKNNHSKINAHTQGQRWAASVLLIAGLLASGLGKALADPKSQAEARSSGATPPLPVPTALREALMQAKSDSQAAHADTEFDCLKELIQSVTQEEMEKLLEQFPELAEKETTYTQYGYTLLHLAITAKNKPVAVALIEKYPDLINEKEGFFGRSPLRLAAENDLLKVVKVLLTKDKVNASAVDATGSTPMHAAAYVGSLPIAKLLLENIGNKAGEAAKKDAINATEAEDLYTPLHCAAREGHLALVKWLVQQGADLKAKTEYASNTPLRLAEIESHMQVVTWIEDHIEEQYRQNACQAVQEGKWQIIHDMLHREEISIMQELDDEKTLMQLAIQCNKLELVRLIIHYIILYQPQIMWDSNFRPLHWAIEAANVHVVRLLLRTKLIGVRRVNLECKDNEGQTALFLAVREARVGVVKVLLRNNADVMTQDDTGHTLMHAAAHVGSLPIAKLLLATIKKKARQEAEAAQKDAKQAAKEAQKNAINAKAQEDGDTPLHCAAREGHLLLVLWLVQQGADLEAQYESNQTPLMLAEQQSKQAVVRALKIAEGLPVWLKSLIINKN